MPKGWNAACPVYPALGYYSDESVKDDMVDGGFDIIPSLHVRVGRDRRRRKASFFLLLMRATDSRNAINC